MKREISVIIPCYNTGKYIDGCLDSAKSALSSFEYEIILVDDASGDDTVKRIEDYITKHGANNIVFIKNEMNIGAGASRNKAVRAARYGLVSFIDSDDYISDGYYEELFRAASERDADVTACDIVMVDSETRAETLCKGYDEGDGKYGLITAELAASPCNKLIKREYLLKYPFAEGIMNEDVASILAIIANCERTAYTRTAKYYYVQRGDSVQNSPLSDKKLDIVKAVEIFEERVKDSPDYGKYMDAVVYRQIICMLLYIPAKEKKVFRRAKFLKKMSRLTKKFALTENEGFKKLLAECPAKSRLFYSTYIKLISRGFAFFASLSVSALNFYKGKKKDRFVIEEGIDREKVIEAARENSKIERRVSVSAAVPNYNYADFLYQRLYSILRQDYRIDELLILDDCSTDGSRELIDGIVPELSKYITVKKLYNDENSGSPFKQWKRAIENASSDYIWIAEADDYCEADMISRLMKPIEKDRSVVFSYADTAYIDRVGKVIHKSAKPDIDIMKTGHWEHDFIDDGVDEIKNYSYLNCTVANVSSAVFRRDDYSDVFGEMVNYRQVGDYLFYLNVMGRGKISFVSRVLNYYRVHGENVTSTTKKQLHFNELKRVHALLDEKYGFDDSQRERIAERYDFLRKVWDVE